MSAAKKIAAGARSIGILLGIWGVLALVAWIAGVLPSREGEAEPVETEPTPNVDGGVAETTAEDAGVGTPVAAEPVDAGPTDAGQDAGPPAPRGAEALWAVRLTEGAPGVGVSAALGVGTIVGDGRPELLVAIGSQVQVVGLLDERPLRVATLGTPGAATPARPVAADVTGDVFHDLVVGYARLGPEGGPIGGTLQLVPGNALGALTDARVLAPIAVTGLATIGDDRGAYLGAANWTDGFGRRASELWTFTGGASPVRRGRVRIGNDASDVVAADLDGDQEVELIALDAQGLTRVSMGGARLEVLDLARATHALAHDLDGDGHTDVVVVAEGLHLVRGGVSPLEALPLDAPHGIRRLAHADVDRDGRTDLLGITREGIVLLQQRDPLVFSEAHTMHLPLLFRPHDLAVVDFGERHAVVVVGTGSDGFELWALPLTERVDVAAAQVPMLVDAPLHLTIPLR